MSGPLHPLPPVSRLVLSIAVLAPWVAGAVVVVNGSVPVDSAGNQALALTILVGTAAVLACLVAVTDPALRGSRGRWVAGFVFASAVTPAVYPWLWHWRRPSTSPSAAPATR